SKSRIMAAAVELFASKGVDKVSLRELTAQANVNIAAVNYHFGSKESLVEAVFEALAREVNGARLAELERLLAAAAASGAAPELEEIVRIFMHPYVDPASRQKGGLLAQMILKNRLNSTPMLTRVVREHFDPMARRFIEAIRLACPQVD